jgi:hypothetical protein
MSSDRWGDARRWDDSARWGRNKLAAVKRFLLALFVGTVVGCASAPADGATLDDAGAIDAPDDAPSCGVLKPGYCPEQHHRGSQ